MEPVRRTEQEITRLAADLYNYDLSWTSRDVRRVAEHFDWEIELEDEGGVELDTGLGMGSGQITLTLGEMTRISVEVGSIIDPASREEQRWLRDLFTESYVLARVALGEPAERIPGETPKILWRRPDSTLTLIRYSMIVSFILESNKYLDRVAEYVEDADDE
ncbi:DUF6301 family protein [Actinomadura sp. WAC 06369]|uniref:DUF6301 family protein n=1 Tax=Actinomadura sp. WAC 06369 TaxID=2203193 RepID=UPI000F79AA81|nr:DUF6301 family protein [Actinomadura sp. WAC 06369]RSN52822.1 hypothetical protein DMH08_28110 [Actinomadura sp. WAC 06369]